MNTADRIKDATFNQRVVGSIPTALTILQVAVFVE
jgi:hypothetical protein